MHRIKKYFIVSLPTLLLTAYSVSAQPTTTRNHVVSNTITQPGISTQAQVDALPVDYKQQQVSYVDGLGRSLQTVLTQANPGRKDIISPVEFDNYGREVKKFLPYADLSSTAYGSMKTTAYADQKTFYNPSTSNTIAKDIHPYAQIFMEFSPASRPRESGAPGETWQPGSGHTINPFTVLNTATDDVKRWTVTYPSGTFGTYSTSGTYSTNDLYKTIAKDENGKQVIEFKDREGKIILKKVQLTATADDGTGKNYDGWLCTYYIYDDFNNLRCVIQPEAVKTLDEANWANCSPVADAGILNEQCFRYEYDARKRMIRKKVPGAGEVYMVYDTRDRLVMTQDANLRSSNKWMATVYDDMNRPLMTGLLLNTWSGNKTFAQHLTDAYNSTTYPFTYTTQPSATYWEPLSETHYEDYNSIPNGMTSNYVNTYDNQFITPYNTSPLYAQPLTVSSQTAGLATWAQVKILGTTTWLVTVTLYDDDGRPLQMKTQNITGGIDIITTQYDFSGKVLRTHLANQKAGGNANTYQTLTKMEYDHAGRVTAIKKTVSSNSISGVEKTIVQNTYDELGQLKNKTLSPTGGAGGGPLETLTYDYNIRGWMLGVNRDYLISQGQSGAFKFGYELNYDKATTKANRSIVSALQYNGNIAGMTWKSDGDDVRRKYDYSYDAANRLLQGLFEQDDATSSWNNTTMNYTAKMGDGSNATTAYDDNGNIKAMTQFGWKLGVVSSTPVDNLTYTPVPGTNRLKQVIDANNDNLSKLGDFKYDPATKTSTDYTYDVNGNLTADNNKKISSIAYNQLNLPSVITVSGKGTITYTYDATGNKLQKTVAETGQPTKTTLYVAGAVYENDVLQFMAHEEGRIRKKDSASFVYDYFIKDHLGNVRMVLTEEQQQDIYPAATLENVTFNGGTAVSVEDDYYTVTAANVVTQATATGIPVYQNNNVIFNNNPYSNTTANSARLYRLNASTNTVPNKTGLGIVLKVMAGDNLNIFGKSYHKKPGAGYTLSTNALTVSNIIGLFTGTPLITGKATSAQITGQAGFPTTVTSLLNNQPLQNVNRPRASINWIILDEQFRYVSGGFDMVGTAVNTTGTFKTHTVTGIPIPKNGYIYIYCSNESRYPVFFDNVQVTHIRGPLVEETHYYPFGLTMAGISSKALNNSPTNKEKTFQGQRFDDELGLNWVQFKWRNHDPQIGRFIEIDPLAEDYEYNSTYAFSENKVISHVELEGLEAVEIIVGGAGAVGAGTAITAAAVAAPVVAVVTHPEVLLSGGGSAAQMDFRVERQLRTSSGSSTNSTASTGQGAVVGGTLSQAGRALAKGKYSDLKEPRNVAPGNKTTPAQRKRILEENKKQNNGQLTSDGDGRPLNPPQKTKKGEKADPNAAQVDHIDPAKPKDKSKPAGSNSNSNLQVLSAEENRKKSNN